MSTMEAVGPAQLFQALSDETRIGIIRALAGGERCVCELQGDLTAAQSRLSFHLRILRDAGLIEDRRQGRWVYYRLAPGAIEGVCDAARGLAEGSGERGAGSARCAG